MQNLNKDDKFIDHFFDHFDHCNHFDHLFSHKFGHGWDAPIHLVGIFIHIIHTYELFNVALLELTIYVII